MSKPSILLIPGSFALPEFYDPVLNAVAAKGYEIRALHLPSVGLKTGPREGSPPTMYDDAAFIAKEAETLADEGKDVVLVAHSYGGVPVTESTKGLGKEERQKQGKKGGIVSLAYMTCLVPAVGMTAMGVLADVPEAQRNNLPIDVRPASIVLQILPLTLSQEKGWMYHSSISESAALTFSDLPKEEGEDWAKKFVQHSAISFAGELRHGGYRDIPVSYLFCEEDLVIPPDNQRAGIDLIEKESGKKVDVTSIRAGHAPPVSEPQKVVDWILDVAGKAAGGRIP